MASTRWPLVGVLLVALAACGGPTSRSSVVTGVVGQRDDLVTVWLGPVPSLHPHETSPHLAAALHSPLVASDPATHGPTWGDDAPGALLADITTEDGLRWELTLKPDRRWHDGTKVTAQDVVRGWQAAIEAGHPLTSTVVDVRAVGTTTVAVALAAPFGQLPALLVSPTFLPLHRGAEDDPDGHARQPVGDGPYRIEEAADDRLVLRAVGSHPRAAEVVLDTVVVDLSAAPGPQVDVAVGADGQLAPPSGAGGAHRPALLRAPGQQLAYLGYPLTDPDYADVDVRRALSLALDVPAIAQAVAGDAVIPADRLVGPGIARAGDVTCDACRHDPEAAAELWPDEHDRPDDGPLTIWFAADAGHDELVGLVAAAWQEVLGARDIQLASQPAAPLLDRIRATEVTGPFRLTWDADVAAPVRVLEPLFGLRGAANDVRLRSDAVDDLLAAAAGQLDPARALAGYAAAEQAILDEVPVIPLWHSTIPIAAAADVAVVLDGEGRLDWPLLRG